MANEDGVPFAASSAHAALAAVALGMRQFQSVGHHLDAVATEARRISSPFHRANWHTLRARMQLTLGAFAAAADEVGPAAPVPPSDTLRGEFMALRALGLAAIGRCAEAIQLAEEAGRGRTDIQVVSLSACATLVAQINSNAHGRDLEAAAARLKSVIDERRDYDSFVTAYRVCPQVLSVTLEQGIVEEMPLAAIVRNSHDLGLARILGWNPPRRLALRPLLTPREAEVFDLMRQGLRNREIATQLYISESTVKVHVRHILEKLGARTRTEAVLRYQSDA